MMRNLWRLPPAPNMTEVEEDRATAWVLPWLPAQQWADGSTYTQLYTLDRIVIIARPGLLSATAAYVDSWKLFPIWLSDLQEYYRCRISGYCLAFKTY